MARCLECRGDRRERVRVEEHGGCLERTSGVVVASEEMDSIRVCLTKPLPVRVSVIDPHCQMVEIGGLVEQLSKQRNEDLSSNRTELHGIGHGERDRCQWLDAEPLPHRFACAVACGGFRDGKGEHARSRAIEDASMLHELVPALAEIDDVICAAQPNPKEVVCMVEQQRAWSRWGSCAGSWSDGVVGVDVQYHEVELGELAGECLDLLTQRRALEKEDAPFTGLDQRSWNFLWSLDGHEDRVLVLGVELHPSLRDASVSTNLVAGSEDVEDASSVSKTMRTTGMAQSASHRSEVVFERLACVDAWMMGDRPVGRISDVDEDAFLIVNEAKVLFERGELQSIAHDRAQRHASSLRNALRRYARCFVRVQRATNDPTHRLAASGRWSGCAIVGK